MENTSLMRNEWAVVRMSDFNLWVAEVGATYGETSSPGTRLQVLSNELPSSKHLLSSLRKCLTDCRMSYGNDIEASMEIVDLIIENLAMLSIVI